MKTNRNLIGFGLFFIVFGAFLLGVRQGWIPTDIAERSWQLWPVLLVAAGLSIILAGRPGARLGGLVAAVCLGVMAGGLVAAGGGLQIGCGGDDSSTTFARESGELPDGAQVGISFRCGDLTVATAAGRTWGVEGASADGKPPTIRRQTDGVRVEATDDAGVFGFPGTRERWDITLPTEPTIDLDVELNAGAGTLTLRGAHLASIAATVNAGSLRIDLRDVAAASTLDGTVNAGSAVVWLPDLPLEGDVTVNAGSLSICAPTDVGLRLTTGGNPLSSNNFEDEGLVRSGDSWETPGFATAPIRIALDVQANAGSVSLNPRQACTG
jgi:cell wall-active antibiotic response 4TMS protein YvqF